MKEMKSINIKLFPVFIIIILLGIYASPLLINSDKAFTLFPKNTPRCHYVYYMDMKNFRDSILKQRTFPFWTLHWQGGRPTIGLPQEISLNPFSLLTLVFGEVRGMNIGWFLFYIFGALSMYYLTRNILQYNTYGALLSAIVFSMSGYFAYLQENGLLYSREMLLSPLLMAFFIKARGDKRYIIISGFILTLFVLQSALYVLVVVLFLFLFSVFSENKRIDLVSFLLLSILALLFSVMKILPILDTLKTANRISNLPYSLTIDGANTFSLLYKRLFVPLSQGPGKMYIGHIPMLLCAASFIFYFKETKRLLAALIIFTILSFGPNSIIDLHKIIRCLPFFSYMFEIAKYYGLIIMFIISVVSGYFFFFLDRVKKRNLAHGIGIILISIVYINLLWSNIGYFNSYDTKFKLSDVNVKKEFFQVKGITVHSGDETILSDLTYFLFKKNIGLLNSHEPLKLQTNVVPRYLLLPRYAFLMPYTSLLVIDNPAYKGEAFFLTDKNKVEMVNFGNNKIYLKVRVKAPDRLIINQNYDYSWRSTIGKVENYKGFLSVRFNSDIYGNLLIYYFPTKFYVGLIISLVSIISALVYFRKKLRVPII